MHHRKLINRKALGAVVALVGVFGASQALAQDACGARKFSKGVNKAIGPAQKAAEGKNWQEVLTHISEAEAAPGEKNAYDNYFIHEFKGTALVNLKDYEKALPEFEATLASPCIDPALKAQRSKVTLQLAYQTKNYPKVIELGSKIYAESSDTDVGTYVANAYYIGNDFENSRKTMQSVIEKIEAKGAKADEQSIRILQSACVNLKDDACVVAQIERLVALYPKESYWQDLINSMLRVSKSDRELLNILRLADGADIMKDPSMFTEMAQLSMAQGLPGEAQSVLQKGFTKGVFSGGRDKELATRLLGEAKTAVTLDKSTLGKQDASAKAKPAGDSDVKLGAAYLSYNDNPKAVEALQRGLGKGGVKAPDEANLLLGIAQLRSANKPEAEKAFGAVKDPAMARIGKMWLLTSSSPPAAAPAGQ